MTRPLLWILGASAALAGASCDPATAHPGALTVTRLEAMLSQSAPPKLLDANSHAIRRRYGIIPGATLLPNARYDVHALLPPAHDTSLVFYCSSRWCSAAWAAAERASRAGYHDVNVLSDGIKGWRAAGKAVERR